MPGPSSATISSIDRCGPPARGAVSVTRTDDAAYRTALSMRLTSTRRSASGSPTTTAGTTSALTGTFASA